MLINVLSCVDPKQAWVVTEEGVGAGVGIGGGDEHNNGNGNDALRPKRRRKVVTLADIRREYQDELDRVAAIQNNQFGFAAGDEMEIL